MNDSLPIAPVPEFKDRTAGLLIFGIIEILLGCACALLVPFMLVAQVMGAQVRGGTPDYRTAIPGVIMYGVLAGMFIWLGIGSIRCRRWARTLMLIGSWSWLLSGVVILGFMVFFLPTLGAGVPDGPTKLIALTVAAAMMFFIFILLPATFVIFYQSKHVKATCEQRDPSPNWTDGCPSPVLTLSLCFGFGAVMMLPMIFMGNIALPFFGMLLSGVPGILFYVFLIALTLYLAWGLYRLQPMAWWIALFTVVLMTLSSVVTFLRVDPVEMYRLMGYPQEQIEQIQKLNFFSGNLIIWVSAGFSVALVGYLFWIKRYFRPALRAP